MGCEPYMNSEQLDAITRNSDWIQTYTGRQFFPLRPRVEDICIEDIAHALSNLCRFTGHVTKFYSVAEHSVRASFCCTQEDALWALLHDASEAYLVDVPRPLKYAPVFGELYRAFEKQLMDAVCDRFGLPREMPASVKKADDRMLMTEARDLLDPKPIGWRIDAEPYGFTIEPWRPVAAEWTFLEVFYTLTGAIR